MSQRTMAEARQYEMKTSIAVVTTMICGRGDVAGGAGWGCATRAPLGITDRDGSRRRSRRARGGARAILFGSQRLEQRAGVVGCFQEPRAATLVVQQPRRGREHLQMRAGAVGRDDQQQEEVRRL